MDFAFSDRCNEYRSTLLQFMDDCVYPNEPVFHEQLVASGNPNHHPAVMEEMKAEARRRGLWNLFQPHKDWGPGLTNLEYAPLAEIMINDRGNLATRRPESTARATAGSSRVSNTTGAPMARSISSAESARPGSWITAMPVGWTPIRRARWIAM